MNLFIFKESNGEFSWRKALTCICGTVFSTACIGYLVANKFGELPNSYQIILGGVFAFYFGKKFFENLRVTNGAKK